jgi:phytoene synthase
MSSALHPAPVNTENNPVPAHQVLQRYGKSFHFASLVLDRATAERCARLYAFCRYVDDIADEADDRCVARERLGAMIEMLAAGQSSDPVVADFLDLASNNGMPVEPAIDLAKGVISDLSDVRIKDLAELHVYCYRVAGTVGLMMCGVLGVHDPRAFPFAIDLGIAMQMTNIARDVSDDAAADRRYLPATMIGDVSPAELINPNVRLQAQLAKALEQLLQEAESYYQSGQAGLVFLPTRSRLGIRIAARVYRQIGIRLRRRNFAVWRGRVVVPLWEKLAVSAIAMKEHFALPGQASKRPLHRQALHRSLQGLTGVSQIPTIV